MKEVTPYELVESKIIQLRDQNVILDSDVAELYGVETKRINEAVKNNPDKFPAGYIFKLNFDEWESLKSKFSTSNRNVKAKKNKALVELVENFDQFRHKHSPDQPKAFTEKGLYMLATILKSPRATETTLSIIETFTKVREIERTLRQLPEAPQDSTKHQALAQKAGDLISDLILPDSRSTTESEASVELNLAVVKLKYQVKKKGG